MRKLKDIPSREIVVPHFWWDKTPLYRDQLGWQSEEQREARSIVSKKIFDHEIVLVGLNLAFYYPETDTYYGLHTESYPIEFKVLPYQCIDTHVDGEVLYSFENREDIWNGIKIDGMSLEYVLDHSVILCLN